MKINALFHLSAAAFFLHNVSLLQAAPPVPRKTPSASSPSISFTPQVNSRAFALLSRVPQRLRSLQTLACVCTHTTLHQGKAGAGKPTVIEQVTRLQLMRPNRARLETSLKYCESGAAEWHNVPRFRTDASDGRKTWRVYHSEHEYQKANVNAAECENTLRDMIPLTGFFDAAQSVLTPARLALLRSEGLLRGLELREKQPWQGHFYRVVRLTYRKAGHLENTITEDYYLNDKGFIPRIHIFESATDRQSLYTLTNVHANTPMAASAFAYQPPDTYHTATNTPPTEAAKLPDGTVALDFTLRGTDGKPVRLADYRGKTVVLDFWATWCGPCLQALPEVNSLAAKWKARDVVVLAIDAADARDVFHSWRAQHTHLDALIFVFDPAGMEGKGIDKRLYRVGAFPTVYVIAPNGTIATSFVGYDNNGKVSLENALRRVTMAGGNKE